LNINLGQSDFSNEGLRINKNMSLENSAISTFVDPVFVSSNDDSGGGDND